MKFLSVATLVTIALAVFVEAENFDDKREDLKDDHDDEVEDHSKDYYPNKVCDRYCNQAYSYGKKYEHNKNWKKYLCTRDFHRDLDRCKYGCRKNYYHNHWSKYIDPYYKKNCERYI